MESSYKKDPPKIELNNCIQESWTQQETDNVKVVVDFFQHLMNEHDFEYTLKKVWKRHIYTT